MAGKELSDRERYASQYREGEGMAYAWGKTARLLTETSLMTAFQDTTGDFLAVDLCCSYPIYRQIMIGQHGTRTRTEMGRIAGAFLDDLQSANKGNEPRSLQGLDPSTLKRLKNQLAPKDSLTRQLMQAPLFDVMCVESTEGLDEEAIRDRLCHGFKFSTRSYEVKIEPAGSKPGDKGTWQYMVLVEEGTTLKKDLAKIVGEEIADALIDDISTYFAQNLVGKISGFRVISLDRQYLKSLSQEAERSFPTRYRNTRFFRAAGNGNNFARADVRDLPFGENSVSFFSCIEGWPFYGTDFKFDEHIKVAIQIGKALKPGGQGVFFPWSMQAETAVHRASLERVEEVWEALGLKVSKLPFGRDQLKGDMSSREYDLVHRSPVFKEGEDDLISLILEKPKQ